MGFDVSGMTVRIGGVAYYLLGAPFRNAGRSLFKDGVLARYGRNEEKALDNLLKINDRIINKARGMISFNAILAGISKLLLEQAELAAQIAFCLAILSALFNLVAFYVVWEVEEPGETRTLADEIDSTVLHCCQRAILLNLSIVLSLLACTLLLGTVLFCV
ncbi:MAG: hypothetical protein KDA73_17710 [Rhodobacteraceae bacterium]|nr:hypothetical protein [Paracoccaceae bacterium]